MITYMGYHLPASNPALSYPSAGRALSIHESLKLPPIDLEMLPTNWTYQPGLWFTLYSMPIWLSLLRSRLLKIKTSLASDAFSALYSHLLLLKWLIASPLGLDLTAPDLLFPISLSIP